MRSGRYLIVALSIVSIIGLFLGIALLTNVDIKLRGLGSKEPSIDFSDLEPRGAKDSSLLHKLRAKKPSEIVPLFNANVDRKGNQDQQHQDQMENLQPKPKEVVLDLPEKVEETVADDTYPEPNYDVHIFYYPWYGNPEFDGVYLHWNHEYLPHWDKEEARKWPSGRHEPPDDIGSNFYPKLGPYSSKDPAVIENHMKQIRSAGVGVLAVSWYPPGDSDQQGRPWDHLIPTLLDAAHRYKLKICFHIEPYKDRTHLTLRRHLEYLTQKYGGHPGLYRRPLSPQGPALPLYYIYDSYLVSATDWAQLFQPHGALTVRGTDLDGIFVGLLVDSKSKPDLVTAGFDGIYTYFASDGFTFGSNTRSWISLAAFARNSDLLFIPSVGPGYIDERVRPWNKRNTKKHQGGKYYEDSFRAALAAKPQMISITSFNEWHEGTQIETALPKQYKDVKYLDYTPNSPEHYLQLTRKWVEKFGNKDGLDS